MQTNQYGAHEVMELHEVLNGSIDGINTLQLYIPHAKDAELRQILTSQLQFMTDEYNRLLHLINGRGAGAAIPYRPRPTPTGMQQAGMASASAMMPNMDAQQFDDRDVSSATLGCHKASAKMRVAAALECADWEIRSTLLQGTTNCANQAYEIWGYMNRRGYYPLLGMQETANTQLLRGYQPIQGEHLSSMPHLPSTPVGYQAPSVSPNAAPETNYSNSIQALQTGTESPVQPMMMQQPVQHMMQQSAQPMMQQSTPAIMQQPAQPMMQPLSSSNSMLGSHVPQEIGQIGQPTGNASSIFSSASYRDQQLSDGAVELQQGEEIEQLSPMSGAVDPQPAARMRKKPGNS